MMTTYGFNTTNKQCNKEITSLLETESANSGNQFYDINTTYCQPSNLVPHFWFYKIVDKQGNPDLTSIMILSEILGWFRCLSKPHNIFDSTNQSLPKLINDKLAISYDFLADKLNFQKERIRRKLVSLETIGFVSREIKNIVLEDGSRINQLFISIDQEFFQSCFRDPEHDIRVGNDEFISTGNTDFVPSPLFGGDLISNKNKKNKDRSMKSNFILNNSKEKELETTQLKAAENHFSIKKIMEKKGFKIKKKLKDFYPLTEEDCSLLQSESGRSFSINAMNEILLDMSKKVLNPEPEFWSKKGFIAYMSKAFTEEMRDELKVSNISFKIRNNYTEIDKQEKFLSEIESCIQVTPEWQLKRKLAAMLERNTAYNFLLNYQYSERVGDTFKFYLSNEVSIGAMDRQIILNQVKATQERVGDNGYIEYIENIEFVFENKWKPDHGKAISTNRETDYLAEIAKEAERQKTPNWLEVRKSFITQVCTQEEGINLDRYWLSKLTAKEDKEEKKIILDSNNFVKDWVKSNYLFKLERIAIELGYEIEMIRR